MPLNKIIGRLKFQYYDKKIKYQKYRKLSVNNFVDYDLYPINYFFMPDQIKKVDIEQLDFNFLNERAISLELNSLNYQGSYYFWNYNFSYMEYLPKNIQKIIVKN